MQLRANTTRRSVGSQAGVNRSQIYMLLRQWSEPVPLNGCSSVRSLTGDQLPLFGQSDYSLSSCKLDVSLRVAQLCPLMRDMVDTTRHDIQSMRFTAISALQQDLA